MGDNHLFQGNKGKGLDFLREQLISLLFYM